MQCCREVIFSCDPVERLRCRCVYEGLCYDGGGGGIDNRSAFLQPPFTENNMAHTDILVQHKTLFLYIKSHISMQNITRSKKEAPSPGHLLPCFIIRQSLCCGLNSGRSEVFIEKAIWSDKDKYTTLLILLLSMQLDQHGTSLNVTVFTSVCVHNKSCYSNTLRHDSGQRWFLNINPTVGLIAEKTHWISNYLMSPKSLGKGA